MMRLDGLRPSDIEELAKARDVTMKIGPRVFRLTPTQMSILSEFAASFTPSGETIRAEKPVTKTDPVIPPDVPSESNKASLEQTLKWLKQELSRDSSVKDGLTPRRIEASDFGGCRIRYRFIPLSRNSPISNNLVNAIMEYELNLADLRPDLITTVNLEDYSRVYFTTRNNEPKIKAISRANDNGFAGRTVDEKAGSTAFFNLSNANAAAQVKVALAHAINLCQAGALARPLGRAHLFGEKSGALPNSRGNAPFGSAGRSK
jgi:hypothetical protein